MKPFGLKRPRITIGSMVPTHDKCVIETCYEPPEPGAVFCQRHRGGVVRWTLAQDRERKTNR